MKSTKHSKSIVLGGTTEARDQLPEYEAPPVDEVALSIQFSPVSGFNISHFGQIAALVRNDYPRFEARPPIASVTEQSAPMWGTRLGLQFVTVPEFRCWYIEKNGNRLFQVQHDRFMYNWRRVSGDEPYPRYPNLRDALKNEWHRFCDFLRSENLESPQVNQCEVTYVNHIEYSQGWKNYGELHNVIATWAEPKSKFLPPPEGATMEVHYRWPDGSGRLHVSMQPVIRVRDGKEVLQLTLIARGAPKSTHEDGVFASLDHAREWVVKGFADFTSETMQKTIWRRT